MADPSRVILLIDPDSVVRGVTRRAFEQAGFAVVRACSVKTALKVAQARKWRRISAIVTEAVDHCILTLYHQAKEAGLGNVVFFYAASWDESKNPALAYFRHVDSPRIMKPQKDRLINTVKLALGAV